MSSQTEQIRALNDQLRQNLSTGLAVLTAGVAALGPDAVDRIVKTIGVFDDFCHAHYATDKALSNSRTIIWTLSKTPIGN